MNFFKKARKYIIGILTSVIITTLIIFGCKSSPPPIKSQDTLILLFGGLGKSQVGDIQIWINKTYPTIGCVTFGEWDSYKNDISAYLKKCTYKKVILIGHSFGCAEICQDSVNIPKVQLTILLDPVAFDWNDLIVPASIQKTLVFRRTEELGPPRANITSPVLGSVCITELNDSHDGIPHDHKIYPIMKIWLDEAIAAQ